MHILLIHSICVWSPKVNQSFSVAQSIFPWTTHIIDPGLSFPCLVKSILKFRETGALAYITDGVMEIRESKELFFCIQGRCRLYCGCVDAGVPLPQPEAEPGQKLLN